MPIATIYGDCASRHAYKLYLAKVLLDLDVAWVFSDISQAGTRALRQQAGNPMGQVPSVVLADGRALPESNAALMYLTDGTTLMPTDPYERAQVLRWMMFEQNQIDPALAVSLSIKKASYPMENADLILGYLRPKVERLLTAVETHLAGQGSGWFVGEAFSIADIVMYAYLHEAEAGGFDIGPALGDWIGRVGARPRFVSVAEAMAIERAN